MSDVGQNRDEAIRRSNEFSRGRLIEAGRQIAAGDYEGGLFVLGEGLHTVQDRVHDFATLPSHLTSPRMNYRDYNPTEQQETRGLSDTEEYLKDFWSVLKNDLKLSDKQIDKIKKDLEKY